MFWEWQSLIVDEALRNRKIFHKFLLDSLFLKIQSCDLYYKGYFNSIDSIECALNCILIS